MASCMHERERRHTLLGGSSNARSSPVRLRIPSPFILWPTLAMLRHQDTVIKLQAIMGVGRAEPNNCRSAVINHTGTGTKQRVPSGTKQSRSTSRQTIPAVGYWYRRHNLCYSMQPSEGLCLQTGDKQQLRRACERMPCLPA